MPRPLALSPSRPLARLSCPRRPLTLLPSPPAGLRAPAHQLDMAVRVHACKRRCTVSMYSTSQCARCRRPPGQATRPAANRKQAQGARC